MAVGGNVDVDVVEAGLDGDGPSGRNWPARYCSDWPSSS